MRNAFITVLLFCASSSAVIAQKGGSVKGTGMLGLGGTAWMSETYFDANADRIKIRTNGIYMAILSGEYYTGEYFGIHFRFPFFARGTVNRVMLRQTGTILPGNSINSLGDAEVGAKFRIFRRLPLAIMPYVSLGLPFGKERDLDTDAGVQTGDGEFNQMAGVELRYLLPGKSITLAGYCAFNHRTEDYSDDIRFGVNATYDFNRMKAMIGVDAIESLFNDSAPVILNGIFSNHLEILAPKLELGYRAKNRVYVYAGGAFPLIGRNVLDSPQMALGVQYHFSGR